MTDKSIITLFDTVTLLTKNYHWIHSTNWNDSLLFYFKDRRSNLTEKIFHPPIFSSNRKAGTCLVSRWILQDTSSNEPRGWAEFQIFRNGISKGFLLLSLEDKRAISDEMADALIYLVSAIFVVSSIDIIMIGPLNDCRSIADFFIRNFRDCIKKYSSFLTLEESYLLPESKPEDNITTLTDFATLDAISWRKSPFTETRLKQLEHIRIPAKLSKRACENKKG